MKSRIAILSCLAVAAMMVLPTVSAGSMTVSAETDKTEYTIGEDVQIHADWRVTDPNDFDHDRCYVHMDITWSGGNDHWIFEGWYDVPEQNPTGSFPVWCGDADGFANHWWDTTGRSAGTYSVQVDVTAWDDSQTPPNNVITGGAKTNDFTLS